MIIIYNYVVTRGVEKMLVRPFNRLSNYARDL